MAPDLAKAVIDVASRLRPADMPFTEGRLFNGQVQYRFLPFELASPPTPWMVYEPNPTVDGVK